MIAVHLTRTFHVEGDADLAAHVDVVFEHLLALEDARIRDADVSGSLTEGIVELSIYAIGESFDDAADHADAAIRSAIHAAGGSTPDWTPVSKAATAADLVDA